MARAFISVKPPNFGRLRSEARAFSAAHKRAAFQATDIAASRAQKRIQARMKAAGLGRLSNAVGYTSAYRKRQTDRTPYGVIFAKGGDDSLAGGALEAYSKGVTIRAKNGTWLAYATSAVPRLVGVGGRKKRITPSRYRAAGLESSIGKLIFKKISANMALLVVRKVSLSPKTGQAKALGKGRPRTRIVPEKDTVVFVLIRQTRRAKRFDKDVELMREAKRLPDYMRRLLAQNYR